MLRAWLFIPGVVLLTSASSIRPHQTDEESLKTALDAVTRKQRSLDFSGRDYYGDLQNFKYRPNDGDNEATFPRLQNQDLEDNDEDLEFLPLENGQLENIGGGYQNYNDKRLERALLDYLESSSDQREAVPSSFRERERTGSQKRALMVNDRGSGLSNEPDRDLAALMYKELQKSPASYHNMADVENRDYLMADTLQPYYDRYHADQSKLNPSTKFYGPMSSDPMSWGEIFGKSQQEAPRIRGSKKLLMESPSSDDEDSDEIGMNNEYGNRDRDWMYMLPTERRNVNGRYPLGREYGAQLKRYPLTKRSPKPLHHEKETSGVITDPKVAQDLGPLFGSQKPGGQHSKNNRTSDDKMEEIKDHDHAGHDHNHSGQDHEHSGQDNDHSGHDHDHSGHDHDHSGHDHDHSGHDHSHDHSHEHDKTTIGPSQAGLQTASSSLLSSSPASLVNSPKAPGQKELNSNSRGNNGAVVSKLLNKRADHVQLTKKSVDWSDYFGIDRRRKKAALFARPGSQDRDDEWMLQRYYKTMAENLKSPTGNDDDDDDDEDDDDADKDNGEKRNKLDQMDTRLKNVKNLIVEDALKYGSEGNSQEVKDVVMARLAAAYSLEKMRRALNEFRSNIAAQRDLMRAAHANNNETRHYRDSNAENKKLGDNEKRDGHGLYVDESHYQAGRNYEGYDEGRACSALDTIVDRCPRLDGKLHAVQELCIMHQICLACDNEVGDCASMFTFHAEKICQDIAQDPRHCVHMVSYSARQPSPMVVSSCHHADSCLRRSYRYRQRGIYYQNGWPPHVASLDPLQLAER